MNAMVSKRDSLVAYVSGILNGFDNFNVADRLRWATFRSDARDERVRIMGDPTAYAEVVWIGRGEGSQVASLGQEVLEGHLFRINVWYAFKDDDSYAHSSQKTFDDICEGDQGLLYRLRNDVQIPNLSNDGEIMYIYSVGQVQVSEVSLDTEGLELAHFLTFTVSIR
jgi:hypothetical protein